ncbi:hypothetical protein ACOME3_010173 [Neoechinorhynchus agilis]
MNADKRINCHDSSNEIENDVMYIRIPGRNLKMSVLNLLRYGENGVDENGKFAWTMDSPPSSNYGGQNKFVWIAHNSEGFVKALLLEENDELLTVEVCGSNEKIKISRDECQKANPAKFSKVEDMAELTCLNEASVLHNLKERYFSGLFYTYSGLFCVVVNPYKKTHIYSDIIMKFYKGKRLTDAPPHIFAVTDAAYRSMLQDREDQSILCTGESGAGKTENTKKIIQYLAYVAAAPKKVASNRLGASAVQLTRTLNGRIDTAELELQLLQANPILESFGNAKTVKNDNSSRFGKFIRINFDHVGYISGASIETYLLEKSRTVRQAKDERSFHIFYQLLNGCDDKLSTELLLKDVDSYTCLSNGYIDLTDTNDSEEFKQTLEAMRIMNMGEELNSILKTLSAILLMGNMTFMQDRSSEQATLPDDTIAQKLSHLLGLNVTDLTRAFLRPKLKVGRDYVHRAQNINQAQFAVEAISKAIYQRLFRWIVNKINKSLDRSTESVSTFIGILDMAGFEIFQINSFEQLCINYTNEKLQQLFNHTMFILEQEEYAREKIDWRFVDFGLDLQPTIDLIEKQMGVMSLLDEECWFPRATDKTYVDKLISAHGTHPKFLKPTVKTSHDFSIVHYAGRVNYCADQWLLKNKDPLNDNVVALLQSSNEPFVREIWKDAEIVSLSTVDDLGEGNLSVSSLSLKANIKKGMFRTVGQTYKEQLSQLMNTLQTTSPNFVRCIIPNQTKQPGKINSILVLEQLRCNGVLEGIRICRHGFPNRIRFQEFRQRYEILCSSVIPKGFTDGKMACKRMLEELDLDDNLFRIGMSKIFFRAGVLAHLEEERDRKISEIIIQLQTLARGALSRRRYMKRLQQVTAIHVIQRNGRVLLKIRNWQWWRLLSKVKPILPVTRIDDEIREKEKELSCATQALEQFQHQLADAETRLDDLIAEKSNLVEQLNQERELNNDLEESRNRLQQRKMELENLIEDLEVRVEEESNKAQGWVDEKVGFEKNLRELTNSLGVEEKRRQKLELELISKNDQIQTDLQKFQEQEEKMIKLSRDKDAIARNLKELEADYKNEKNRCKDMEKNRLNAEDMNNELTAKLNGLVQAKNATEKTLHGLESRKDELEHEIKERNNEILSLKDQLSSKSLDLKAVYAKLENESDEKSNAVRELREARMQLSDLKDEISAGKDFQRKIEHQMKDLAEENEALRNEIANHSDVNALMQEQNRKRDKELSDLKQRLFSEQNDHQKTIQELKIKHANESKALNDHLDNYKKECQAIGRDKASMEVEVRQINDQLRDAKRLRSELETKLKQSENRVSDQMDQLNKLQDEKFVMSNLLKQASQGSESQKSQIAQLEARIAELEAALKLARLDVLDLQQNLEHERKDKCILQVKLKQYENEVASLMDQLDEKNDELTDAESRINSIISSFNEEKEQMKINHENELDELKRIFNREKDSLLADLDQVKTALAKLSESKKKLRNEFGDVCVERDRYKNTLAGLEKAQRNIDRKLNEEKALQEKLHEELEASESNNRDKETKLINAQYELANKDDMLKDANNRLKELKSELDVALHGKDDVGRNACELERANRMLEHALDDQKKRVIELEDELSLSDTARLRCEVNMNALKQSMEKQIQECINAGDEKNRALSKQLRDVETELDEEKKARGTLVGTNKKLRDEIRDANARIDDYNRQRNDDQRQIRKLTVTIKEITKQFEEAKLNQDQAYTAGKDLERRILGLEQILHETQVAKEDVEKQFRLCMADLAEVRQELEDAKDGFDRKSSLNEIMKLKAQIMELEDDLADETADRDLLTDQVKKLSTNLEQLNSELTDERNALSKAESARATLERQNNDLYQRYSELEQQVKIKGKGAVTMLESRITVLEEQLDNEQKEKQKGARLIRSLEKKLRESNVLNDENKKAVSEFKEQIEKTNAKIRHLKRQSDERDEEISKLSNRLRKAQREKEEANEMIALRDQRIGHLESRAYVPVMRTFKRIIRTSNDAASYIEDDIDEDLSEDDRTQATSISSAATTDRAKSKS